MIEVIKKRLLVLCLLVFSAGRAQEFSFGLKAGIDCSISKGAADWVGPEGRFSLGSGVGRLGGIFAEYSRNKFLLRPELYYDETQGEFRFSSYSASYTVNKLSLPLLFGYAIFDHVDIFGGPAYQHILSSELRDSRKTVMTQIGALAAQVGFKFNLQHLEIDLRYDFSFPARGGQSLVIRENTDRFYVYLDDGQLHQFLLSVNYKLFENTSRPWRRGRGGYF